MEGSIAARKLVDSPGMTSISNLHGFMSLNSIMHSLQDHVDHVCDNRTCPVQCQLCKRLCANPDHLHGLTEDAVHLCGYGGIFGSRPPNYPHFSSSRQEHSCSAVCQADGICEIDTAPQSIEATFTGRHETFQYTKARMFS